MLFKKRDTVYRKVSFGNDKLCDDNKYSNEVSWKSY